MGFHVPFEHRRCPTPIYIGFETTPRVRRSWNWWAFWGFPLSLMGIFTAGLLAPVALFVNAVAVRRRPRRLATAGLVISLAGMAMLAGIISLGVGHARHEQRSREARALARVTRVKVDETHQLLVEVGKEFDVYRAKNDGRLPAWVDANMVAVGYVDAWETPLRFDAEIDHAVLRSAGPDGAFDTRDDVTVRIDGQSPRSIAAEVPVSE